MATGLVVERSLQNAKTINKYLGKDYKVLALMGRIRQSPKKEGSVDIKNDFEINKNKPAY